MDEKELERELDDLKSKVDRQHHFIMVLLDGGTALNKRMDILESLAQALGIIVKVTDARLEQHLDMFRESGAIPAPKDEPKKDEPKKAEPKKDVSEHPEFG